MGCGGNGPLPPWGEAGGISADPKPLSPCESQATEEPPWGEGGQLFPTLSAQAGDSPGQQFRVEPRGGRLWALVKVPASQPWAHFLATSAAPSPSQVGRTRAAWALYSLVFPAEPPNRHGRASSYRKPLQSRPLCPSPGLCLGVVTWGPFSSLPDLRPPWFACHPGNTFTHMSPGPGVTWEHGEGGSQG